MPDMVCSVIEGIYSNLSVSNRYQTRIDSVTNVSFRKQLLIHTVLYVLFRSVTVFVGVQLCTVTDNF